MSNRLKRGKIFSESFENISRIPKILWMSVFLISTWTFSVTADVWWLLHRKVYEPHCWYRRQSQEILTLALPAIVFSNGWVVLDAMVSWPKESTLWPILAVIQSHFTAKSEWFHLWIEFCNDKPLYSHFQRQFTGKNYCVTIWSDANRLLKTLTVQIWPVS